MWWSWRTRNCSLLNGLRARDGMLAHEQGVKACFSGKYSSLLISHSSRTYDRVSTPHFPTYPDRSKESKKEKEGAVSGTLARHHATFGVSEYTRLTRVSGSHEHD